MKFDTSKPIPIYQAGRYLQQAAEQKEGEEKPKLEDVTLGKILEFVLISADPREHKTMEERGRIYKLVQRIYGADPLIDLEPEDIVLIKKIVGNAPYPIVMTGALCEVLNNGNVNAELVAS